LAKVKLVNVTKRFGNVVAVDHISFSVEDGEFFALLGPSGCGKTTTLRIIAGLETPDEGEVYIDDELVNYVHPKDRNVAMVFQNYALYPHMTVYDNIAFPLMVRRKELGLTKEEIRKRVYEVAKLLQIEELLDRYPAQLSGGQQQRVALARALVRKPRVWLLDEPLSNLDAKLRVYMRAELKRLQRELGVTTIYVTHDQVEAMSMADRIAVMNKGRIMQIGKPLELYHRPANVFVATFIGSPPMNIVECSIEINEKRREAKISCPGGISHVFSGDVGETIARNLSSDRVLVGIRPEHIKVVPIGTPGAVKAKVLVAEVLGADQIILADVGGVTLRAKTSLEETPLRETGSEIGLLIDFNKIHIFDARTENVII
jgi:multiple sugar transport system ATP-binding protein